MKKTIKINENDLRKYVKQIIKKTILETGDVNEISPELARKAKQGALADARSRGKSRETSRMMAVPDHKSRWEKAGPIENRKRDQANVFKKGAQERAGNPFYDESHPDYADIKRKGMNIPDGSPHRLAGADADEASSSPYRTKWDGIRPGDGKGDLDFSPEALKAYAKEVRNRDHEPHISLRKKHGPHPDDVDEGTDPKNPNSYDMTYGKDLEPVDWDAGGPIDFSAVDAAKKADLAPKAPTSAWGKIKKGVGKVSQFLKASNDDIDEYWVDHGTDPESGESKGGHKAYNHPMDLGTGFDFSKETDQPGKIKTTIGKLKNVFAGPEDKTHPDSKPGSFYATSQRAAKESYESKKNVLSERKAIKYNFKKIALEDK